MKQSLLAIIPLLVLATTANVYASKNINSNDTMINDIPPDGKGLFCDHPSNPGSCYDRNDNAGDFCLRYPEYTAFCPPNHYLISFCKDIILFKFSIWYCCYNGRCIFLCSFRTIP